MKEKLEQIRQEALSALPRPAAPRDLDALRVQYLGKRGELTNVLKMMGSLSAEERPVVGQLANEVRAPAPWRRHRGRRRQAGGPGLEQRLKD